MFNSYKKAIVTIGLVLYFFSTIFVYSGEAAFNPWLEAQMLALEVEGQLRPSAEMTEQIYNDLAAIRSTYPQVANVAYRPKASPYQLLVGITEEAAEQFRNGQYHALDELNELYGVIKIESRLYSPSFLILTFNQVYNTEILAQIYTEANSDGVRYVEPNYLIGDGSTIIAELPFYIFIKASGDCPSGCTYHEYWPFKVEGGLAVLWDPAYSGGLGTEAEPYKIGTVADWNDLMNAATHWNKHFIMTNDLDLAGVALKPIGRSYGRISFTFNSIFDGKGHTIRNADINSPIKDYVGLFGRVGSKGKILNLGVENVNITGKNRVGGLVGYNRGIITNCYATGTVIANDYIGGLAGHNDSGTVNNCYAAGIVDGNDYVGGLVGYNYYGNVVSSFWDVNSSSWTTSAGGEGKTTDEMKTRSTFTSAGWDFFGETANGTEDIWTMCEGISYPKFTWQNQPPIANAGPDQTIYAWIDGVAEAELDGLDSNDPDCNELTYFWNWTIDGITFEANGVNQTILLPVGVHTIQLVVNDGIIDSIPDDVNITVIAPLKSKLQIMPCVLNRDTCNHHKHHHKPGKILAIIRLPEGVLRKDIDNTELLTIYPGGIKAQRQWILPYYEGDRRHRKLLTAIWAYFDRDDILDAIPANGKVELKAAGKLKTGRYFYGSDTVRIIAPPKPHLSPKK